MAKSIETVGGREKLKARHEPHWITIRRGCHLGFRKVSAAGPGAWVARFRDADSSSRALRSLGTFDDLPPSDRFGAARAAAEEWFKHMGRGGKSTPATVAEVCRAYLKDLRDHGREPTAKDAEGRFRRWVFNDPIGKIEVQRLTPRAVREWRLRVAGSPTIPQDKARRDPTTARSPATVNRDMTALRAALNFARAQHLATDDAAWAVALQPMEGATGRRNVYLDAEQRRKLIDAAPRDLAAFLRGLSVLPLRPGALAQLRVCDFDRRLGVLTVGRDKSGGMRRLPLPEATVEFFAEHAKGKLPAAPLLSRADGACWTKDAWKHPVKDAATAAGLPPETTAYALRHSTITDLIALHRLPTLTVARLAGTSLPMIERHYGHLLHDQAKDALAALGEAAAGAR